jgi:hypothetical protein
MRSCAFTLDERTIVVGDALGRVHFLKIVDAHPAKRSERCNASNTLRHFSTVLAEAHSGLGKGEYVLQALQTLVEVAEFGVMFDLRLPFEGASCQPR